MTKSSRRKAAAVDARHTPQDRSQSWRRDDAQQSSQDSFQNRRRKSARYKSQDRRSL